MDKTLKITAAIFIVIIIACAAVLLSGTPAPKETPADTRGVPITGVYYFYGEECPHCHKVMPFIVNLSAKYPEADIRILEVWHNQTNQQLYEQVNAAAGVTYYGVPEAMIGKVALIGEENIPAYMEAALQDYLKKKV